MHVIIDAMTGFPITIFAGQTYFLSTNGLWRYMLKGQFVNIADPVTSHAQWTEIPFLIQNQVL